MAIAEDGDYGRAIGAEARKPEWEYVWPVTAGLPPYDSIEEAAARTGKSEMETFLDLAVESNLDRFFIQAAANQDQGPGP